VPPWALGAGGREISVSTEQQAALTLLPMILVFGHSHMQALVDAYNEHAAEDKILDLVSYQFLRDDRSHIVNINGKWQYHPDCLSELGSLIKATQPEMLVSMLQGEQAIISGLIGPEKPFEFYFPSESTEFDESIDILPFDVFFELCKEVHGLVPPLLDYLKPVITVPAFALCFPPPICDSEFILENTYVQEIAGERKLADMTWRYRIWKSHALALQAIYQENSIHFVNPPPESYDDNGCLLQPFWADAFHANSQYGYLLLRQLKDLFTGAG
jgi:hypothetical protein